MMSSKNIPVLKPPELELNDYLDDWADWEGTEEELTEYLQVLWEVSWTFARMGFHEDPVQQALAWMFKSVAPDSANRVEKIGTVENIEPLSANDNKKEIANDE